MSEESREETPKKHKGGRPPKRIKRSSHLMVRLTVTERLLIEGKAREARVSPSEWFRQAAKKAKVVARISAEELQVLRMLSGMANNLNQIAKMAHAHGLQQEYNNCMELLTEIDQYLQYLNNHDRENS